MEKDRTERAAISVLEHIRQEIGDKYMCDDDMLNLQTMLVKLLGEKHLTAACAESLTGGLVSAKITEVPGASGVFSCGVCTYSNAMKNKILGVRRETLQTYTEYSTQTALEMASGVRKLSGADIGIATTGIAGPSGGSKEKPVGLVYVAVDSENCREVKELRLNKDRENNREHIRLVSALYALYMALRMAEKITV